MIPLSQRDPRWSEIKLGTSDLTIGTHGCTITALAMLFDTTPDVVNEKLKAVGGFSQGSLVIWKKIEEAFPGSSINRVWAYDNEDVAKNLPCLVEVDFDGTPKTNDKHWVVYKGNQELLDPWTGTVRPTSVYPPTGYTIVKNKADSQTSYIEQLNSQIQATSQCQSQLKVSLEQNTKYQEQLDSYISQLKESNLISESYRKKYEDEQQRVIHLKDEIAKIHAEDKNFAQEALDAQHLSTERLSALQKIAKHMEVEYDATNDKSLVDNILEKIDQQHKDLKSNEIPEIGQLYSVLKILVQMGINPYLISVGQKPIDPQTTDPQLVEKVSIYLTAVTNQILGLSTPSSVSQVQEAPLPVVKKNPLLSRVVSAIISVFFDAK